MKKLILFLSIIFSVYQCEVTYSLDTLNLGMLPLNNGNVWIYSVRISGNSTGVRLKHSVIGDTIAAGSRLSLISKQCALPVEGPLPRYIRMDTSRVSLFQYKNGSICMFDSLQSGPGAIAEVCSRFIRECESRGTTDLFNVHISKVKFASTNDYNQQRYYASSLGIFISYDAPYSYHLIGCVIDNVVYGDTSFSLVGISQINSEIPDNFSLSQNYPNPFNPATQIGFKVAESGLVRLTVFDVLGKEVDVLVNEELQVGSYEADWNASAYPSGVYYYKLESGSFTETKKMVLLK